MKNLGICCLATTLFILSLVVEAERLEDNVRGFRPGIVKSTLIQELEDRDWDFKSRKRHGDGMEVVHVAGRELRFWIDNNKVIAVGGDVVEFREYKICVNFTDSEVRHLLGEPDRIKVQAAMEDVGDARFLYYKGEKVVLRITLGNPVAREMPEWIVTYLHLYEEESNW